MVLGSNTSGHLYDTTLTADGILYADANGVINSTAAGTATNVLTSNGPGVAPTYQAPATSGTVTAVSVVSTNGFAGTVANASSTPAITLTTTQTGVLSGNGTAVSGSAVTQYDVLVGGASNAVSSVGPGTAGQVLQSGGNAANPVYSTATYPATAGTSGNVLTSNGTNFTSAAPATPITKAFFAYASSTLSNVTGASVIYTILFDSTTRNDGTAYNTGTGLFSAPVTGFYSFSCTLDLVSGTAFSAGSRLIVSTNGSVMSQVLGEFNPNPIATFTNALLILSYSWMQKMTAGDTVGITIVSTSTLQDISVVGNAISSSVNTQMSTFSGFLAGT